VLLVAMSMVAYGGSPAKTNPSVAPALKDVYAADFLIGAAIQPSQLDSPAEAALLRKHFSSITAENVMKPATIGSSAGSYNFAPADRLIEFAQASGIQVRGHTLVWHRTAPQWFFEGDKSDLQAYRARVRQRLESYITTVVSHFKGKVYVWDVVNEAASDIPGKTYREDSPWFVALGSDYIEYAFRAACAADPHALLFLNDYNTELPGKRENVLTIVKDLLRKGVPIDGVGHQLHLQVTASTAEVNEALTAVEKLSLHNQVTELDVSVYADPSACFSTRIDCSADFGSNVPDAALVRQARLYRALFETFKRHAASIDSVTTWGIADNHTWLDSYPVTRTNLPLLFDTQQQPKRAFWAVTDPAYVIP
jgi:endo-1,4-beta-xylanase